MTMTLLLLAGLPGCMAFRAFDCNSQSSQIEQYSLLDPEPCGNMEKVHAIERELYGGIVQIKKEVVSSNHGRVRIIQQLITVFNPSFNVSIWLAHF